MLTHFGVYAILVADIPSKVLEVCLFQLVLFYLDRYAIHNAITLHEQFAGFLNLVEFFITETMMKENKARISENLLQFLLVMLCFNFGKLDAVYI